MIVPGDIVYLDKRGCFGLSHDPTLGTFNNAAKLEKNTKYIVVHAAYGYVRLKHNMVVYRVEHFKKFT